MRRRALLAALPALLAGCEELRTPQAAPASVLTTAPAGSGGPVRSAAEATAAAFANQGAALAGRPAEAAVALARFEAIAAEVANRRAWPELSETLVIALRTAQQENRAAAGIAAAAPAAAVVQALGAAAARLRAQDRAGAAAALPPRLFEPGGAVSLDRLGALGPLPAAEQASAALLRDLRRLDLDRGWAGAGNWWQAGTPGAITDGLGAGF